MLFCSTTHLRVRGEVPRFDTPSTNLNQVNVLHAGHHIVVMRHHASCLPRQQLAILGVCLFNKKTARPSTNKHIALHKYQIALTTLTTKPHRFYRNEKHQQIKEVWVSHDKQN